PQSLALLGLYSGAAALELLLGLVGLLLGSLLQNRLRRAIDQVLGFLQPEARERADLLDDLDLLVPGAGQDHVELGLLLGLFSAPSRGSSGNRDGGGSGDGRLDVERLLEGLDELGQVEERHLLELIEL